MVDDRKKQAEEQKRSSLIKRRLSKRGETKKCLTEIVSSGIDPSIQTDQAIVEGPALVSLREPNPATEVVEVLEVILKSKH